MWRRIGFFVLIWAMIVGLGELMFIYWFRVDGTGRHNYGIAFANEQYVRRHLGEPCSFQGGISCTEAQIAEYHHETTVDFWLDVRDNSIPVLLRLFALLVVCVLSMIVWERWQRGRRTLRQRRL